MKTERLFRWSAVGILALTAAAKLLSATGSAPILDFPDPLFGLPNRYVLVVAGTLEAVVVGVLLSRARSKLKHLVLAWLGANFLAYRVAFYALDLGKPCPCLGTMTERLPMSQSTVDLMLWIVVVYLLAGSVCVLIRCHWPALDTGSTRSL